MKAAGGAGAGMVFSGLCFAIGWVIVQKTVDAFEKRASKRPGEPVDATKK